MWILVLFDLPVKKPEDRKAAGKFRNSLLKDGYMMLQFSVYARPCKGQERTTKHIGRLKSMVPQKGRVRLLQLTDLQFGRMHHLTGEAKEEEKSGQRELFIF